jgi:hypothetical protein
MRDAKRLQRILDARAGLWRWRLAGWLAQREAADADVAARRSETPPVSAVDLALWTDASEARAQRLEAALSARQRAQGGMDGALGPLRQSTAMARSAERLAHRRRVESGARAALGEALDLETWDAARRGGGARP